MANNNICLSCHQEHESDLAFCEICLPWCIKDRDSDPEPLPKLDKLSFIDYLHKPEFAILLQHKPPESESDWADLICEIYDCLDDSDFHPYIEQLLDSIDEILHHITSLKDAIQIEIERISASEFLALSYYANFDNLDPSDITGKSKIEIEILDYKIEFKVISTKHGDFPTGYYTPTVQNEYASMYSLRVAKINGIDVRFQKHQIPACAEFIALHRKGEQNFDSCVEVIQKRHVDTPQIDIDYNGSMPTSFHLWMEVDEIINGNRGSMANDLLRCTLYNFEHLDISEELLDASRIRSFQFLKNIVSDLKDKVTPIREGLLVESIGGNCYQIQRTNFKFAEENHIVFWSVYEIYTNEFICIELKDMKGPRLPEGDYLATIVLSLYDDHESSNLIHTLAS